MKQSLIGWEFVGVLVGVSTFSPSLVGVFPIFGGSFGSFTFFRWEFSFLGVRKQFTHCQSDVQIVTETVTPHRRIILRPHRHRLGETLHRHP